MMTSYKELSLGFKKYIKKAKTILTLAVESNIVGTG